MHVQTLFGVGALSALAAGALVYLEPAPGSPAPTENATAVAQAEARAADALINVTTIGIHTDERDNLHGSAPSELLGQTSKHNDAVSPLPAGWVAEARNGHVQLDIPGLLSRAKGLIAARDIRAARAILGYATRSNQPEVWIAFAETYNPVKLSEWNATAAGPDLERSRQLYATARAMLDSRHPKPARAFREERALWAGLIVADGTQVQTERD